MRLYYSETTEGYFGVLHSFDHDLEHAFKFLSHDLATEQINLIREGSSVWDDYELKIVEYDSDSLFSEV